MLPWFSELRRLRTLPQHHNGRSEAEQRLRDFLEYAPDGIFVADLDGRYTDVNRAGCELLGYAKEEIIGKAILDLLPPEEAAELEYSRQQLLTGKSVKDEWHLRRKDGSYMPVEVSANILADGRWQGFVRDISDRKQLENALRESEERLRMALQASPVIVFVQDQDLRYTWIHNARSPFSTENIVGKTEFDFMPTADAVRISGIKRKVLETGTSTRTLFCTNVQGDPLWFDLTVTPLRDESGRIVGVTGAASDVTDRQRAIAARDQVLGIVAHDLRSPLNTIQLQAAVLEQSGAGIHGQKSAAVIRRSARRMSRLIDDMLDVARLDEGGLRVRPEPLEPHTLFAEVLDAHEAKAKRAGMELQLESTGPLPKILADHDRLLQVLDNLVDNALKFSSAGSRISISATPIDDKLMIQVADTGPGLSAEQREHLFDRFWQAKAGDQRGAGLGLPIAKGIVELHGGRIWAESEDGHGTTVNFTVPIAVRLAQ